MHPDKHIEECIASYIAERYRSAVEVGIGKNFRVAERLISAGVEVRCTDLNPPSNSDSLRVERDDVFEPAERLYEGAELIYSIRPGVEMIPPLIELARRVNADLLVYHLGNEIYKDGGKIIDCGVILHQYHARRP